MEIPGRKHALFNSIFCLKWEGSLSSSPCQLKQEEIKSPFLPDLQKFKLTTTQADPDGGIYYVDGIYSGGGGI